MDPKSGSVIKYAECRHVAKEVWTRIINSLDMIDIIESVVLIDYLNVKPFYIPSCDFKYFFDYNEFWHSPPIFSEEEELTKWMVRNTAKRTYIMRIHVCDPTEILRKVVVQFKNLLTINCHFFILNKNFIEFMVNHFPNLKVVNFENSIGIKADECLQLTKLHFLEHLNLKGSDVYESDLEVLLTNCRQLKSLNISNNCAITGQCLIWIPKHIERLDIRDCWQIEELSILALVRLRLNSLLELLANSGVTDRSLLEICNNCPNIKHLTISFDYFSYDDNYGRRALSDNGFSAIGQLKGLKILTLKHVGKLTDHSLQNIFKGCVNLEELTLNLRHRHQLTDKALDNIDKLCPKIYILESVHNHFIAKHSLINLSLMESLQCLILRGNELVDDDVIRVINNCHKLVFLNLDGTDVTQLTLDACICRAKQLMKDNQILKVSLIWTLIDRSVLYIIEDRLPNNMRVRVSGPHNHQHFSNFDGKQVLTGKLKTFFPYFWVDFT